MVVGLHEQPEQLWHSLVAALFYTLNDGPWGGRLGKSMVCASSRLSLGELQMHMVPAAQPPMRRGI